MDAFVDKVKAARGAGSMQVVSLRSLESVSVGSLRSTRRHRLRQRDDAVRSLGACVLELLHETRGRLEEVPGHPATARFRQAVEEIQGLDREVIELDERLGHFERIERASSGEAPFLTVCSCGAPLFPQDRRCGVCGQDVEGLIRLASESKARVATVSCGCGAQLTGGIRFCPQCGRNVAGLLRERGLVVDQSAQCSSCGEARVPGDRFCSACGRPYDGA